MTEAEIREERVRRSFLDTIQELQARCTCTPTNDVRDCPNYQPGDEELMEDPS